MMNVFDEYHDMLESNRSSEMSPHVWNGLVDLKKRFDSIVCCVGCGEFCPKANGAFRVLKCGHVVHKACFGDATRDGKCKSCE
jgi:hypothetical protein